MFDDFPFGILGPSTMVVDHVRIADGQKRYQSITVAILVPKVIIPNSKLLAKVLRY